MRNMLEMYLFLLGHINQAYIIQIQYKTLQFDQLFHHCMVLMIPHIKKHDWCENVPKKHDE